MGKIECTDTGLIKRNCKLCEYFKYEEIGDSDFGSIFAETPSCDKYHDIDENDKEIEGFDRDMERECCVLDFIKVAEIDTEIEGLLNNEDTDNHKFMDKAYRRFKEKYNIK